MIYIIYTYKRPREGKQKRKNNWLRWATLEDNFVYTVVFTAVAVYKCVQFHAPVEGGCPWNYRRGSGSKVGVCGITERGSSVWQVLGRSVLSTHPSFLCNLGTRERCQTGYWPCSEWWWEWYSSNRSGMIEWSWSYSWACFVNVMCGHCADTRGGMPILITKLRDPVSNSGYCLNSRRPFQSYCSFSHSSEESRISVH